MKIKVLLILEVRRNASFPLPFHSHPQYINNAMGKHDAFMEKRILEALKFKERNPRVLNTKIAIKYSVTYFKLWARIRGIPAANTKGGQNANLLLV